MEPFLADGAQGIINHSAARALSLSSKSQYPIFIDNVLHGFSFLLFQFSLFAADEEKLHQYFIFDLRRKGKRDLLGPEEKAKNIQQIIPKCRAYVSTFFLILFFPPFQLFFFFLHFSSSRFKLYL